MDDAVGERHPEAGANLMGLLFGERWYNFCLYHSRYYSKRHEVRPSKLCAADKLAFGMTPKWLYLFIANLSGEIWEYMRVAEERRSSEGKFSEYTFEAQNQSDWYDAVKDYLDKWAYEFRNGDKDDTWTPNIHGENDGNV